MAGVLALVIIGCILAAGCTSQDSAYQQESAYDSDDYCSAEPLDYSKVENWIINDNADLNTDYDLIYFCGSVVTSSDQENGVVLMDDEGRAAGYENYMSEGSQLSENARVFCPLQRQLTFDCLLGCKTHDDLLKEVGSKEPYIDIEAALDYYFEHYNKGAERPFVLAGHSQGSMYLQICLERYFLLTDKKDYLKNMIAAYSLGFGVSKKYFESLPNNDGLLHFANGADDFNCLISWNSEGPGEKGPSTLLADEGDETLVINPLNWKRDETYAGINENQGVLLLNKDDDGITGYQISLLPDDLCDAQIDLERGSVICSTLTDYVKSSPGQGDLFGGKSLHGYEGRAYYNNMKDNLKLRLDNFMKSKNESK